MSITKLVCAECGAEISQAATGRPRHTCSDACRSKAHRRRHPNPARETGRLVDLAAAAADLSRAETRRAILVLTDRASRERDRQRLAADRTLFADERQVTA